MAKCPKTRKTQYDTHDQAQSGILHVWANDSSVKIGDLHSYVCPHCGKIHVGHVNTKFQIKQQEVIRKKSNTPRSS